MNSCGGLKAVVVSDTINGVILLIGGFFVVICALLALGKDISLMECKIFLI